jgi:peptide-methionine (S)-S-oxide reductase
VERATFAAGCFWGVEAVFRKVDGVVSTRVGYTGGSQDSPSYEDVCTGVTGHTEAVEVGFDPSRVSYEELLQVFWDNHDPTTVNRQGPDVGTQYRSAIFFHTPEQKAAANAFKDRLQKSGTFKKEIVTEIVPASMFYLAEDYHQQYLEKQGLGK